MTIRVEHHHYFHVDSDDSVRQKLDSIITLLAGLKHQEEAEMTRLDDLKVKLQTLSDDVAAETNIVEAAKIAIDGLIASNEELRQQLENQGVPQEVLDLVDATIAAQKAQRERLAAAIPAGTPAVPAPPAEGTGLSTDAKS